ncbi:hypothetical protein Amet_1759 [Alkaliphilus metalliredigens QYMF]|uniref:Lipoprotein n=1 Tax=Alkaliphilus metalliredigens (strain QYMF) TaxID=293826 RepID=A6TP13_ALKMQ|nr:hypothetical protein [Alkaliphilus metalliredigens]ABR47931.1 hypothetical protein Amet_1759 [Alkaliphilus metalliredigens QYMF]
MKKFAVLILLISSLFIVSSCGRVIRSGINDYYGEYHFELPFNHSVSNITNMLFFKTDYSMERMNELINEAGYNASLHENGNIKTILISAVKNEFTYYFVIYDKNHLGNTDVYTLSNAMSSIDIDVSERVPNLYVFLVPLHILDTITDSDTKKVYNSFDYIANFYRATGKNDVEIDDVNKTIIFKCEGNPNFSWVQGVVIMQYSETETGNYLEIKPL